MSRGLCIASHRSRRRWTFDKKSGLLPNTRARISAIAAVPAEAQPHWLGGVEISPRQVLAPRRKIQKKSKPRSIEIEFPTGSS
jgi:hypothetical protein